MRVKERVFVCDVHESVCACKGKCVNESVYACEGKCVCV